MILTVQVWTGREVRALRDARRMSIRTFAATLGVSRAGDFEVGEGGRGDAASTGEPACPRFGARGVEH
jgi:hypothetical protein